MDLVARAGGIADRGSQDGFVPRVDDLLSLEPPVPG
ncbi:hypothetical protein N798_15410 [Knoellia flava TL1]|uniref:Uncharacterized protein n=1 Tax=Knoellia flava TL1 TaxID=1385518 RepID=A0ABR4XA42_9MICO|nr:hypothetical protein N798_15410 [Knoellia flava TL1]